VDLLPGPEVAQVGDLMAAREVLEEVEDADLPAGIVGEEDLFMEEKNFHDFGKLLLA
jgi:hypothetical protein